MNTKDVLIVVDDLIAADPEEAKEWFEKTFEKRITEAFIVITPIHKIYIMENQIPV